MCYSIPGKIIDIKGKIATIEYFGEKKEALNEFSSKKGDYVYAQAGVIVQILDKKKAEKILREWKSRFAELKNIDSFFAKNPKKSEDKRLNFILKKQPLSKSDLIYLLDSKENKVIFDAANQIRQKELQNSSCIHGIIEFSNYCENNCLYCGIRKDSKIKRYRLKEEEIVDIADYACNKLNFKALVLQSGEDTFFTKEKIIDIIKMIKQRCSALIILSIGERPLGEYKEFYEHGARGALIRFETSNILAYKNIHRGKKQNFENRINLIKKLKDLGYLMITGSIFGIPGQNNEDIVDDILFAISLNPDMYSFGPFIPSLETPYSDLSPPSLEFSLKILGILRLAKKNAKILETTALETLGKDAGKKALLSGANSLMINITPLKYKRLYSIYDNKSGSNENLKEDINKTLKMLYSIGRAPTDIGR